MRLWFKVILAVSILMAAIFGGNSNKCLAYEKIMGEAQIPAEAFIQMIYSYNPKPLVNCSVEDLVKAYYRESAKENIRADVALSQALLETGFFRFSNDVRPEQNNFCGLGALGYNVGGVWFDSPFTGIRAHVQHLLAYAGNSLPSEEVVDPRFWLARQATGGKLLNTDDLSGRWATDPDYGAKITAMMDKARQFAALG